jgi:hypothetical protein
MVAAPDLLARLRTRGIPFVVYSRYPRVLDMPSELEEVPWLEKPTGRDELLRATYELADTDNFYRHPEFLILKAKSNGRPQVVLMARAMLAVCPFGLAPVAARQR